MSNNAVFNATVCIMGIFILSIHVVNIIVKKSLRRDEKILLNFFLFTIVHFATYLTFSLVKMNYTSNAFIIAFYTIFYIMNNGEIFLLASYALAYIKLKPKTEKVMATLNIVGFSLFVLLDILNAFTGIFFTAKDGLYVRNGATMIYSQTYQFAMFAAVFIVALVYKNLNLREKAAFGLYCLLPLVAIILQNIFKGYAIAYLSIILSIEILFLFLNVQKSMDLAKEEEKNKDAQIKLMLSQIQPHFIYNSLSSISTLITIDPDKAQKALDDFTEYLRMNLSSLSEGGCVPFEDELKHIKTYVSLEKMRFSDRINVVYDIQATDFLLPPLTIQPIVENAIKHGILAKIEGGTMTLRTYETAENVVCEISDDGIGFSMGEVDFDANKHFGLKNIKYRLNKMCKAELVVKGVEGKGTVVKVTIPKQEER